MVVISKQNLSVETAWIRHKQTTSTYVFTPVSLEWKKQHWFWLIKHTNLQLIWLFNVCLWLAVVQSGLKLDDRGYCESRNLKREVSQKWINAQSLATFNSLESVVFTNKPTLLANLQWFEEKVSLIWNLIGDLNSVASFVKKHHIDLSHLEKNWKNKINCTHNLILKQCYNNSTPSVKLGFLSSQSPLASVCVFGPHQSHSDLLEVLELTHSPEH